ncbi:efflux transporter outer membrane subunit [Pusillimonas sp. ANT_WB101]|uniref:efflux transporter outer membrane subunit n=1 Tax=Pusillimonas sp. ANT_WB101 TaxID=2597356 RepID=UPI0011ECEA13|nr:efflux transporter outer membrane subunit [Pusillimonas sp. ANT_WB101]KAA0910839.1 efflux transporter outer membrane subunit [Pusillimonas sp. ANT_WB101]
MKFHLSTTHALRLGALALAATLAGCAPLSTRELPANPVADNWPADATAAVPERGPTAVELHWRDYFINPGLQQAIAQALANNPDYRMALLRVEEARAAYSIQRADQFPTIGVGGSGGRSRVPGDLNFSGNSVVTSQYEAYAGLSNWELDLWGRVRNLKDSALQEYLATDAAQRAVRITLIANVANAWLGLRELDERIALANQTIATREESYRIFKRRHDVGATSLLELTQVETLLIQARALGTQLEQARTAQAHALAVLLGETRVEFPTLNEPPSTDSKIFAPLRVGLPSDLLTDRPDIIAAEHRLEGANANIKAARAAFFPTISLTGNFGTASVELDNLFKGGSRAWAFMPSISLPIFDAGRRRANLDLAEVRSDLAVANYERTIQTAFREVADALSARQWLSEQVANMEASVDAQTRRARLAQLRYDSGASAYLEVLDAQRDLLEAQQLLVQARRSLLSTHVSLYASLGGGASTETPDSTPTTPTTGNIPGSSSAPAAAAATTISSGAISTPGNITE